MRPSGIGRRDPGPEIGAKRRLPRRQGWFVHGRAPFGGMLHTARGMRKSSGIAERPGRPSLTALTPLTPLLPGAPLPPVDTASCTPHAAPVPGTAGAAGEQGRRHRRVAIGPAQASGSNAMEALGQRGVRRLDQRETACPAAARSAAAPRRAPAGRGPGPVPAGTAARDDDTHAAGSAGSGKHAPARAGLPRPALAIHHQMQVGVLGQRQSRPAAGAVQQAAPDRSTTGPPVSTGAQAACGGRSQPLLAFWNSQRLPSSR